MARGLLFSLLLLAALPARAGSDRRDPFSVELAAGGGWSGAPTAQSGALVEGGFGQLRLSAWAPYEDGLQGGVGTSIGIDGEGVERVSALAGVRLISGFGQWQTRLDVQAIGDVWPVWGLGARLAFGGLWRLAPGLRAGVELGGLFVAGNVRGGADASLLCLYSW